MRIIKYLFTALLAFIVIGAVVFFVGREVLIRWGVSSVKHSLSDLQKVAKTDRYINECDRRSEGSVATQGEVSYQLRFISSTEYMLEAVCSQFSLNPILIDRRVLPNFITKSPGSSGFFWSDGVTNAIELVAFADIESKIQEYAKFDTSFLTRRKNVVVSDRVVMTQSESTTAHDGPVTSCQGYGYQCCDQNAEIGIGDQLVGVQACEQSCFSACAPRPMVLSFNSNPFFDVRNRTVSVNSGEMVEFLFVGDAASPDDLKALVEFGDGQNEEMVGAQGHTAHTYICPQGECEFTAKLLLTDTWGVSSAQTPVSQIKVVVSN